MEKEPPAPIVGAAIYSNITKRTAMAMPSRSAAVVSGHRE